MKNSIITSRLYLYYPILQFFLILFIYLLCLPRESTLVNAQNSSEATTITTVDVGLILDLDTWVGKMGQSCVSMALSDFYSSNPTYKTRLVLHTRDSNKDIIDAASSAVDLLQNVQVKALLGLQKSFQAEFVANIGTKSQVPVVSFSATSPELSSVKTPFFVRTALNDSCQVKAIGDIIKACGWREVVIMYENSDYGKDSLPYIVDAIQEANARVPYRSVISSVATDEQISGELYKLMSMQTRVFVVHVSCTLGSRLFMKIKEVGMMRKGYAWIITDGLTELLSSVNSSVIESMQGVLGVKPYVPRSKELDNFTTRWRRKFLLDHQDANGSDQLSIFGLWAYDSIRALAMAAEEVYPYNRSSGFKMLKTGEKSTDLEKIGVSQMGPEFLKAILGTSFTGLSGEFKLIDGQLQSSAFQIVNVIGSEARVIGFWTPTNGISQTLESTDTKKNSTSINSLRAIIWPGESTEIPKGWEIPTSEKKLRIGVPVKQGFTEFLKVEINANSEPKVSGFVIDVFKEVMDSLPYSVPYEFVPYGKSGQNSSDYNDMVYEVYLQIKDAVVGDTTIVANRSLYVDFPLPFSESGVAMVVPIKDDAKKNAWIFLKPLTRDLWLTIGAFFILTGLVIWVLEHRINNDFRGQPSEQIGTIFYFSFSTLVFAQKEKVMSNLSRFVMIIWLLVVLIITSSYTASLTSLLTVQQLQPTVTDIKDLIKNGDYVGYQSGSFVAGLMESLNFNPQRLKAYNNAEEYRDALDKGSKNGGVSAIVDEIPYIKLFMAKYCTSKYTIIGPTYKTAGFGFAFPKGSPLVPDISRAILSVTEGDKMIAIEKKWFGNQVDCLEQRRGTNLNSDRLSLDSFLGLFFIAGFTSISAFLIFVIIFLRENKNILASQLPVRQKLASLCKEFDKKKQRNIKKPVTPALAVELCSATGNNDSAHSDEQQQTNFTAIICPSPDVISQLDQGLSSAEPSSPDREHPSAVEIT
ncbi:hypothetical protein MKW98_012679 [Papaver atlanticum]|uniref:Glutamate receptor n=1 Tax=Papaver atlanticum TaxID=357466 RepID=A0AAD4XQ28_9MAGN|nr:hypothetical protein MKW98_012679 [Papaver atlanticum]